MKQVHNIRVHINDNDAKVIGQLFNQIMNDAGITHENAEIKIDYDKESDLHIGALWVDRQQPIRKILRVLQEQLSNEAKKELHIHPTKHLDTGTHCFLRLEKDALNEGKYLLVPKGDCAHVRLNIAAFPATKENAAKVLKEIFTER